MRVLPGVHLVGSGAAGFDLTDEIDSHVYLVEGTHSWALIDAGGGRDPHLILANIAATGVDTTAPGILFLTHGHADHSGGAAAMRAAYPQLRVMAGAAVASWVSTGDVDGISLSRAQSGGTFPSDYVYEACPGVEPLLDGEFFDLGGRTLTALDTPGHADGHMCYLLNGSDGSKTLFSGDCVFTGGRISVQNIHDSRIGPYANSIARLDSLGIDALMPGHFSLSAQRAGRHISIAQARFSQALLPSNVP